MLQPDGFAATGRAGSGEPTSTMNCFITTINKDEKHHLSTAFFPAYFMPDGYFVSIYNRQQRKEPLIIGLLGRYRAASHAKQIIQIPPSTPA